MAWRFPHSADELERIDVRRPRPECEMLRAAAMTEAIMRCEPELRGASVPRSVASELVLRPVAAGPVRVRCDVSWATMPSPRSSSVARWPLMILERRGPVDSSGLLTAIARRAAIVVDSSTVRGRPRHLGAAAAALLRLGGCLRHRVGAVATS